MSSTGVRVGTDMGAPQSHPNSNGGGRVKQTRRRQRLSCVECTKRRQKCDRQTPCGLCTSRGIPDLCRWEPIVIRPTPQRPPAQAQLAAQANLQNATVETLLARVVALEEALRLKDAQESPVSSLCAGSPNENGESGQRSSPETESQSDRSNSNPPDPHPCELTLLKKTDGPVALIGSDVQAAAVALAQLSLAPRTEYVGHGTVLCALHKLGDPELCKLPYPHTTMMRMRRRDPDEHPLVSPIRCLLSQLPPRNEVEDYLNIFFATRNLEFGISEVWLRSATQSMWFHLDRRCISGCSSNGGCPACQEEVNPHWLTLFFGILSVTPMENGSQMRANFFSYALAARRLIEDLLLGSSAAVSDSSLAGSVLSCLASVILSSYLADHGRVSEAWKLIGTAVRCGQALGLHRDTRWRRWEKMGNVETELRTLTWWLLVVADRQYSFVLGRPVMSPKGSFETATLPAAHHGDGSPNPHVLYRKHIVKLSELICEAATKCLGWDVPSYAMVLEIDALFRKWEQQLPARFKWRSGGSANSRACDDEIPPTPRRLLAYQQVLLAAWYLDALMGIHRIYLMDPPPTLPASSVNSSRTVNPPRETCIELAIELTRILVHFYDQSSHWPAKERMAPTFFQYFLFDGAVALAGALSQIPAHPQAAECLDLMNKAMCVLEEIANASENSIDGENETAKRGIKVLKALVRAGGWEMDEQQKGALISIAECQKAQRQQELLTMSGLTPLTEDDQPRLPTMGSASSDFFSQHMSPFFQGNSGYTSQQQSQGQISFYGNPLNTLPPTPPQPGTSPQISMHVQASNVFPSPATSFDGMYNTGGSNAAATVPIDIYAPMQNGLSLGSARAGVASMVMPYDVLQGVEPASESMDFDLDWARLAGMENWYSGGMGSFDVSAMGT